MAAENPGHREPQSQIPSTFGDSELIDSLPVPEILAEELRRSMIKNARNEDILRARERTPGLARKINDFIERKLPVVIPEDIPEGRNPIVIGGPKTVVLECTVPIDGESTSNVTVMRGLVGPGRPEFTIFTPNSDVFFRLKEGRGMIESKKHIKGGLEYELELPSSGDGFGSPVSREHFGSETVDQLDELMNRLQRPDVQIKSTLNIVPVPNMTITM